jgi:glycosyltransferase involved in cell wall biosynthesis
MRLVNPAIAVDGRVLLEPKSGGVFEYADNVLKALREQGHTPHVWANSLAPSTNEAISTMTHWPNKALNAAWWLTDRPGLGSLVGVTPDVFWAPNQNFIPATSGARFVLTVHDLSFERYPEFFSLKQRLWHRAVNPKKLCQRADALLAVSEHTKRDLIELYGIAPDKITVTYPGFTNLTYAQDVMPMRLPERYILHVGAMEPRKNQRSLIDAFGQLKTLVGMSDVKLILVGPDGWRNREIRNAIRGASHADDILTFGFVNPREKAELYRRASVFAFPSFYEGFGLPALEAMAAGAPVVASFASSLGEVVGDAGILIDPYRPLELAEALVSILESPAFAARLSEHGRDRAGRFTWKSCAEKTAGVFHSLAV